MNANHPHNLARRHALTIYQANAIYSFIPKNACSTMRYSLAIDNGFIEGPSQINWIHQNNDAFVANNREAMLASFSFIILRCPYRRIYSAYMDKLVDMDIQSWELHRISQYLVHPHELSFVDFVSMLRKPGILNANVHWRPQSAFQLFKEYDVYYSVEDFGACVRDLKERIGFVVHDARPLTAHSISELEKIDDGAGYANMTAFEILRMKKEGRIPSEKAVYSDEMIAAVSEIYRQDIELYKSRIDPGKLLFEYYK
ncbi:sulfotransferase family 2 domain-containing protein [Bauldia sp.]|uniref:sulfotransferase family 2 domain-containing protein n=1 Tax=Bauldia sp. TaxID=2575872 RepID=UPI0025BA4766|nr:sulfotransferase family 2 domain-containing protein [Bauldia sp.]